jgi:hypothetical protein
MPSTRSHGEEKAQRMLGGTPAAPALRDSGIDETAIRGTIVRRDAASIDPAEVLRRSRQGRAQRPTRHAHGMDRPDLDPRRLPVCRRLRLPGGRVPDR